MRLVYNGFILQCPCSSVGLEWFATNEKVGGSSPSRDAKHFQYAPVLQPGLVFLLAMQATWVRIPSGVPNFQQEAYMKTRNDNGLVLSFETCNNDKVRGIFGNSVYVWVYHRYDSGDEAELCERAKLKDRLDIQPIDGEEYGKNVVPAPTAEEILAECRKKGIRDIKVLDNGWTVDGEMKSVSTKDENLATALFRFWYKI